MEKTELMYSFEQETGEEALVIVPIKGDSLTVVSEEYTRWCEEQYKKAQFKATAYGRLMSGGKKTLKEWANFIGKPIAMNENGEWHWYSTNVHRGCNIWYPNNSRSPSGMLPFYLIDFSGDWKDSLTLPDGWETKGENK